MRDTLPEAIILSIIKNEIILDVVRTALDIVEKRFSIDLNIGETMKRALLIIGMLTILLSLSAYLTETASLENFLIRSEENCDYDNWVSHLAEGIAVQDYNLYAPYDRQTNGFGNYRVPTSTELTQWGEIVDLFLAGMLAEAQTAVDQAGFPYQVVEFHDTDTARIYYILREIPDQQYYDDNGTEDSYDDEYGAFDYGWGLYIYNPSSTRPIIVTVPHSTDDFFTPIIGYDALTVWDASFLLISGSGREVCWTNIGYYTNSKSISDPTRASSHAFNIAYQKFADHIRVVFGQREFSFQVHSYDWNRHVGLTDNQISAGYNRLCPNLPIRDLSSLKQDLINKGDHLMIPANTIGIHEDVFLNQYYSVNYSIHDFTFSDGEVEYPVNNNVDLPGYSQNRQMLYTISGWNDYDSFEPFFHIEMDELPNAYEETENNYKWFYGWNQNEGRWDLDNTFFFPRQYYSRWINDLNTLYDDLFTMDDGEDPTTPEDLWVINTSYYYVSLGWQKSDAYDFDSYEILYATEPIEDSNYQIFDRDNSSKLASQATERVEVTGLDNGEIYFFKIRARDKNGNYSQLSAEVTTAPAPANVTSFTAHGMNESVRLYWTVSTQSGLEGFRVYRKTESTNWEMIDSYLDNPLLESGDNSYEYWDLDLPNSTPYTYRISMIDDEGYEYVHNDPKMASPEMIHDLQISNAAGTLTDYISYGQNPYASDGQDTYWDITKTNPTSNYVWLAFWQPYWSQYGTQLQREVKAGYNVATELNSWTVRVRSDQYNVPLFLSVPTIADRAEKTYLYDTGTGNWHNLQSGPYEFTVNSSSVRTMTLYWGNLQPGVSFGFMDNQIYQGGNIIDFYWSNLNPFLIDHLNLYLKNATDSLAVYLDIAPNVSNYSYILPQNSEMPEAKAYLEVVANDGISKTYQSPYTIAIVPRMNLLYNEPGWYTKSNPFLQSTFTVQDVFGADAMGYVWNQEWINLDNYTFGPGYFIQATDYIFENTTSDVLHFDSEISIDPGWNFVANPHLCDYDISSLYFLVNGEVFHFSEMIAQEMISRAIYVYRDGAFHIVDQIKAQEAFFIKSYANETVNVTLVMYPFYQAPQINPPAPYWSIQLQADHAEADAEIISMGASPIASDGYDFRVDLPSVPSRPISPATHLFLVPSDSENFLDEHLQEEYRKDFASADDSMQFDFILQTECPGLVEFSSILTNIPGNWTLRFYLNNQAQYLEDDGVFSLDLPEAGEYIGRIVIYNYPVSSDDLIQAPLGKIKAYPNPFNPTVTIAFETPLAQNCTIDIYNLKGQKVDTIYKGILDKGSHQVLWHGTDRNGRPVSSGVYFARIKTPKATQNIKMMLMK